MNILVVSDAAWNNTNSFGNTVSNWFENWKEDSFFSFYTRKQIPDNCVVEKYYNISAIEVIKELFGRKDSNKCFFSGEIAERERELILNGQNEQRKIDKLHANKKEYLYCAMELVWLSKIWMNKEVKGFMDDVNLDIIFAFTTSTFTLAPLLKYAKKKNKKVVLFISDDIYSAYCSTVWYRRWYLKKTFRECIQYADKLYGASEELCIDYEKKFDRKVVPLYKGGVFGKISETKANGVLKFVYAGNLLYGREKVLHELVQAFAEINKGGTKVVLEIYTAATITAQLKQMLHVEGVSYLMGARTYEEITGILRAADVVLHVESFEVKQIEYVRLSLSTKIVDCLQCGSGILAIGPSGIASIEYVRKIPGTYIIDRVDCLNEGIQMIVDNKAELPERIMKIHEFAIKHHDIHKIRENLRSEFEELLSR